MHDLPAASKVIDRIEYTYFQATQRTGQGSDTQIISKNARQNASYQRHLVPHPHNQA